MEMVLVEQQVDLVVLEFDQPYDLVKFGAQDYNDYTIYYQIDPKLARQKKAAYLKRHRKYEDWEDPRTAGALSRWILWNKPTIEESIENYIKRFHMH